MLTTLLTAFSIVIVMKFLQQMMLNWIMPEATPKPDQPEPESISSETIS